MPFPILAAAAVVSAGASIFGGISANSAAKKSAASQRELGRLNQKYIVSETIEKERRTKAEQQQIQGQTRARIGASGLSGGATRTNYMQEMAAEHSKQLDWLHKSGYDRATIATWGGNIAADATLASGQASLFGGISSGIGALGSAHNSGAFG